MQSHAQSDKEKNNVVVNLYNNRSYKKLQTLFIQGVDPNILYTDSDGNSFYLLLKAIEDDHFDFVELLLKSGAYPDLTHREDENTALHLVIKNLTDDQHDKMRKMMCLLLEKGANPMAKNKNGDIPFTLFLLKVPELNSLKREELDPFVGILKGMDNLNLINQPLFNQGNTFLHWAAQNSHHNLVWTLLRLGANANIRNEKNETPFHSYLQTKSIAKENLLLFFKRDKENKPLENCLDINNPLLPDGHTLLTWAIEYRYGDVVDIALIHLNANPNITNSKGDLPIKLFIEAHENNRFATIKRFRFFFLYEPRIDINAKLFENGNTLLHWALEKNFTYLMKTLLELGADSTILNDDNQTPMELRRKHIYTPKENGSNFLIYRSLHFGIIKISQEISELRESLVKIIVFYEPSTKRLDLLNHLKNKINTLDIQSPEDFLEMIISYYLPINKVYSKLLGTGTLIRCLEDLAKVILEKMTTDDLVVLQEKLNTKLEDLKNYKKSSFYLTKYPHELVDTEILYKGCEFIKNILESEYFSKSSSKKNYFGFLNVKQTLFAIKGPEENSDDHDPFNKISRSITNDNL